MGGVEAVDETLEEAKEVDEVVEEDLLQFEGHGSAEGVVEVKVSFLQQ